MFIVLNLGFVNENFDVVDEKLWKERELGCIVGFFDFFLFVNFCIFFFGVIFKKMLGEFRMIYYLLYLKGVLINDSILFEFLLVKYVFVDDVISFI